MRGQILLSLGVILALLLSTSPMAAKVAARIKGTVRTPDGKLMEGVNVILIYSVDKEQQELLTDENGKWATVNLRPGEWTIGFIAEGYRPQNVKVLLSAIKRNKDIDIAMIPIPKHPLSKGNDLYQEKKYGKALAAYQKALKTNPALKHALEKIALCQYRLGKTDDALNTLADALAKEPGSKHILTNLTAIHLEKGNLEEGLKYFGQLDEKSITDHTIFYNIGILLFNKGKMDDAIKRFKKCIDVNPDYAKGHYQLALALLNQGDMTNAKKHFREVIRLAPDSKEASQSKDMLGAL